MDDFTLLRIDLLTMFISPPFPVQYNPLSVQASHLVPVRGMQGACRHVVGDSNRRTLTQTNKALSWSDLCPPTINPPLFVAHLVCVLYCSPPCPPQYLPEDMFGLGLGLNLPQFLENLDRFILKGLGQPDAM